MPRCRGSGPTMPPGTCTSAPNRRTTTLSSKGAPSARPEVRGEHIEFGSTESWDYFSGRHRAYESSAGVVIERRIIFFKPWGFPRLRRCGVYPSPEKCALVSPQRLPFRHAWYRRRRGRRRRRSSRCAREPQTAQIRIQRHRLSGRDGKRNPGVLRRSARRPVAGPVFHRPSRLVCRGACRPVRRPPDAVSGRPSRCERQDARVSGRRPRESPALPRALQVNAGEHRHLVIHGAPGVTVSTANDVSFSGHAAAIEYRDGRPAKAFVHRGESLSVNGTQHRALTREIEL